MGIFSKFEGKMEDTFEGAGGMRNAPISPVQIMKKAEKQMRREKMVSAGKQYAPTLYTVLVNPDDDQRLFGFYPTLAGECETRLAAVAASDGLSMDGQPLVRFIVDDGLKHGKFDVIAEVVSAPIIEQLRAEEMQRYGMGGASMPSQNAPYGAMGAPAYGQSAYGQPAPQAFGAYPAQGAYPGAESIPPVYGGQEAKPPLPYVPEEEIDRSVDYGEYTFDSKNFADYRREEAMEEQDRQASGMHSDEGPLSGDSPASMENDDVAQADQRAGMGAFPAVGGVSAVGGVAAAGAAYGASPAPYGMPNTVAFTAGAGQANPVPNQAAVRARLIDLASNRSYDLATNRVFLGRETGNDIVVNDLNASRQHAQIEFEPQGIWVITDLGSTNGTLVNGSPVQRRGLQDGDRIVLGVTEFLFTLR